MTTLMIESYEDLITFMRRFWRTPKDFDPMPYLWSWGKNSYPLQDLKEVVFKLTDERHEWIPSPQLIAMEMNYHYRFKRSEKRKEEAPPTVDEEGLARVKNLVNAIFDDKLKF